MYGGMCFYSYLHNRLFNTSNPACYLICYPEKKIRQ